MYCPECGGEYRPEIAACPTCEVSLTDEPEDAGLRSHGATLLGRGPSLVPSLIDLVGFIDEHEARDARRRLKEARIASELVIRDAFAPPGEEVAGDEYWIRVPGAQARAAADLLGLEPALDEAACPSCGAPLKDETECSRCGHRFDG